MNDRNYPIKCIVAGWVFVLVGIYLGYKIDPAMFARFGSIMVLFGVAAEYALLKSEMSVLYERLRGSASPQFGGGGIPDLSPTNWSQKQSMLAHVTVVIGTFVWGFGDLYFYI